MKRNQPERALQRAVAEFLARALPPDAIFSALPGGDGKVTLAPGYRSGLSDMIVVYRGEAFFIELKSKTGRVSKEQIAFLDSVSRAGAHHMVCRSVEDVESFLRDFGKIPLRARTVARAA